MEGKVEKVAVTYDGSVSDRVNIPLMQEAAEGRRWLAAVRAAAPGPLDDDGLGSVGRKEKEKDSIA
jgi:hypothetical protein